MPKVYITKVTKTLEQHVEDALTYIEWEKLVPSNARIFFKPNLTYPTSKSGVTTTPEFIEAVLHVFAQRTSNLTVGESDGGYRGWPAEMAFSNHRLPNICHRYGARLVNLSKEPRTDILLSLSKGKITLSLPSLFLDEIDLLVTLPVPKIHQITTMSGAIKNQWGCIPDNMRLVHHPYFDELILEINRLVKSRLALADGTYFLNRTGPMVGGDPIRMDLLLASDSIGAMDMSICDVMGLDFAIVRHLRVAQRKGWIPPKDQVVWNTSPQSFCARHFFLHRTLRSRVVAWAFDRPWAITLFWNSWFADVFHKVLYAVTGNRVREDMATSKMS